MYRPCEQRGEAVGIFKKQTHLPQQVDPSDALIALCALEGEELRLVSTLILDYQGGGLMTKPESIEILQRVPSAELQAQMNETAWATLETFTELDGSTLSRGIAHGIFVTSLWDSLGMTEDNVLPIHRAISRGTISAIVGLLQRKRVKDASYVALLGQCLYMNASDWENSRR
jgi:hypothetical protein